MMMIISVQKHSDRPTHAFKGPQSLVSAARSTLY